MKPKLIISGVSLLLFGSLVQAQEKTPKPIPGQFIVVLKESAAKPVIKNQRKSEDREEKVKLNAEQRQQTLSKVRQVQSKRNIKSAAIVSEFADVLAGFSAKLSATEK